MSPSDSISSYFERLPKEIQNYIIELAFIQPLKERPYELLDNIPYSQREVSWSSRSRLCSPLTSVSPFNSNYIGIYSQNYNILRVMSGMSGLTYSCDGHRHDTAALPQCVGQGRLPPDGQGQSQRTFHLLFLEPRQFVELVHELIDFSQRQRLDVHDF